MASTSAAAKSAIAAVAKPSAAAAAAATRQQQQHRIASLRSQIFQTAPPPPASHPGGLRTGAKILSNRLKGPSMLSYYAPTIKLQGLQHIMRDPEDDMLDGADLPKLMYPKEKQRFIDVERKKKIGKGPPKKGAGKRAALKTTKRR